MLLISEADKPEVGLGPGRKRLRGVGGPNTARVMNPSKKVLSAPGGQPGQGSRGPHGHTTAQRKGSQRRKMNPEFP